MAEVPILALPNFVNVSNIACDASHIDIGVPSQERNPITVLVGYNHGCQTRTLGYVFDMERDKI